MTPAQAELHSRTGDALREAFGELVRDAPDGTAFFVGVGRIGVRVEVEAVGEQDALVEAYSWIAQGVPADERVNAHLIRRNSTLRFGALCVDGEGDIILRHALFPEQLSKQVLMRLIQLLSSSADSIDQELRERFGPAA